jgi:hypothetical protein
MKTITIKVPNNPGMRLVLKASITTLGVDESDYLYAVAADHARAGDEAKAAVLRNQAYDTKVFGEAIASALRAAEDAGDEATIRLGLDYIGPPRKDGAK